MPQTPLEWVLAYFGVLTWIPLVWGAVWFVRFYLGRGK